jgi:hypothetical protein
MQRDRVHALAPARIKRAVAHFPDHATPRKVWLTMEPWTIAGLMTLKLKRKAIEGAFAKEIAGLYAKRPGPAIAGSSPFDHISVKCSASNRPIQFSASFASTPPFAISSTSDETWIPAPAIGNRSRPATLGEARQLLRPGLGPRRRRPYGSRA